MSGGRLSRYEIVELLDRGETGELYRARDLRDGGLVALELLPAPRHPLAAEQLRREAAVVAGLDHPHVCPVLDLGDTAEGGLFLVHPFCGGEKLGDLIERGPLGPEQAVGLASQIAAALGRAHEQGIFHGDLRPANVLVDAGQCRVGGFGLFCLTAKDGSCPASVMAYRSPEQVWGGPVDARTDVWSLGVLLYEMLTGRHPFRCRGELEAAILEQDPEPMSSINPGIPTELDEIVAQALSKNPAGRPQRMDDLLLSLRGLLAGGRLAEVEATLVQIPGSHPSRPAPEPPGQARAEPRVPSGSAPEASAAPDLSGRRVAQYQILGMLGGGAMGTVYKAEDTRLRRTVALKFLPMELARDPRAKERFFQEAQAASALDHPNICTVHEVGETEDGQLYLAMASYDGETVKAKIRRGPLPVAEALDIARQTAQGLAKAHREGIVHRDVKPANLVVTGDGVVKIVDFGVAKLRGTAGLSMAGSFLGTPAYMSPEQARGEEVDPRADVWSLGVLLYEMLAGSRPFRGGEELTTVLRSILEDRPEPLGKLRPGVPPELERIVGRMLAKAPADRYPTAAEALAELAALQTALTAPASRRRAGFWAVGGLAVLALAATGYLVLQRPAEPVPVKAEFTRVTDEEGREFYPSLSPDGRSVAYARNVEGQLDVFVKDLADGTTINLTEGSHDADDQPTFSPDGRWIAFRSEREGGGIWLVPAVGGPARRVSNLGYNPSWSPDGRELAVATEGIVDPAMRKMESRLWQIEVATGRARQVLGVDAVQPNWSPHGQRIAFWGLPDKGARRILWTVPAAGGTPTQVLDDGALNWNPVWSPDGKWLYFGSDRSGSLNLWRLPIDEASGAVLGEAEPVTTPAMWSGFWSVARDGRHLVYAANESRSNIESFAFDPDRLEVAGPAVAVTRGSHLVRSCDVSPDGEWIAFHAAHPGEDLFVVRANGEGLRQLTKDPAKDRHPFWSPDGRRLLFYSNRNGSYEAWTLSVEGGEPQRVLPAGGKPLTFPVWSPEGRRIACTYDDRAAIIDLSLPLSARRPQPLSLAADLGEVFYPYDWSADGESLAGNMSRLDGSTLEGIGVYFPRSRTYQRWTSRGSNPIWLRDSRRLLYIEAGKILAFDARTYEARDVLAPPPSSAYQSLSISPDDRRLFAIRAADEGDIWMLTLGGDEKGS